MSCGVINCVTFQGLHPSSAGFCSISRVPWKDLADGGPATLVTTGDGLDLSEFCGCVTTIAYCWFLNHQANHYLTLTVTYFTQCWDYGLTWMFNYVKNTMVKTSYFI